MALVGLIFPALLAVAFAAGPQGRLSQTAVDDRGQLQNLQAPRGQQLDIRQRVPPRGQSDIAQRVPLRGQQDIPQRVGLRGQQDIPQRVQIEGSSVRQPIPQVNTRQGRQLIGVVSPYGYGGYGRYSALGAAMAPAMEGMALGMQMSGLGR